MYEFFKNIAAKNSCQSIGVCSVHPSINSLYELLLSEVREISSYLVKLNEFKMMNKSALALIVETLSIFLINTSFNQQKYLNLIQRLYSAKNEIKEKYLDYCSSNQLPCETINSNFKLEKNTGISELIKFSENNIVNRQKNCDKKKFRLFELITIFARLCSIDIVKIKKLDPDFDDYDYEIARFFALTNGYSIRNEKIIRRISEFSQTALKIREKLFSIYREKYGNKEDAAINLNVAEGHSILVSGDDLDELDELLKTLEKMQSENKLSQKVNVYTNGALFLAHFYPYFKNNKFLKGHWGSDNAEYDFSNFPGSILITQNFIQKIDSLYRGEIFSSKIISFNKVFDIKDRDYMPVILSCLKLEGFSKDTEKNTLEVSYDAKKTEKFIKEFNDDEIIIVTGKIDDAEINKYKDKKIINLNCPCEVDILMSAVKTLKEKNAKLTLFFAQCNLSSLFMVLSLLNQQINISIANCPYALINPHVTESLKEDFGVKII